jgi:hypothetical protein
MSRIYRDARVRKLDTAAASRLIFMLAQIGKILEAEQLERRLDILEKRIEDHGDRD